ncbi:hypothetical protein BDV39DRAFT_174861 [Aspergillus sergii]|uniref:Uncharacterized protein n=1 Tax=Aspergillus sergii TaxID=1034303 RepID=A0A5N6X7D0_9EURO|nr:hypothetical protein BDV39DRAFT_174861 [Aspergillus sergii]
MFIDDSRDWTGNIPRQTYSPGCIGTCCFSCPSCIAFLYYLLVNRNVSRHSRRGETLWGGWRRTKSLAWILPKKPDRLPTARVVVLEPHWQTDGRGSWTMHILITSRMPLCMHEMFQLLSQRQSSASRTFLLSLFLLFLPLSSYYPCLFTEQTIQLDEICLSHECTRVLKVEV